MTLRLNKFQPAILLAFFLPAISWAQPPLLIDSFESGDMSTTNKDGFQWEKNNRTSIVTPDRVVWNNGPRDVARPEGRDWQPKTGSHALRFNYAAGEPMAEQRFRLGQDYKEIWFSFWLKVPHNYEHKGRNRKLFALWMDGYSSNGQGTTIAWEFWPDGDKASKLAISHQANIDGERSKSGHQQHYRFIRYPEDHGRWMQLVLRARASDPGAENGLIQAWQRWEDEQEYRQMHDVQNAPLNPPPSGPQGWARGYVLGWANDAYNKQTEWLMDDFTVSKSSLLEKSPLQLTEVPAPPRSLQAHTGVAK